MFRRDQRRCAEVIAVGPEGLRRAVVLVSATIRQTTPSVEEKLVAIEERGAASGSCWGMKRLTYEWIAEHAEEEHHWLRTAVLSRSRRSWTTHHARALAVMERWLRIPGLGMAKAGFLTQLTIGESWCADTNNLLRYGIDYGRYEHVKNLRYVTRMKRIDAYLSLGERLGGSARLWNRWCAEIARKYPEWGKDADGVSRWHPEMLDNQPF